MNCETKPGTPAEETTETKTGRISDISELALTRGRIMGVDFGDVRTGIAMSDIFRQLSSGICVIKPGGIAKAVTEAAGIAREQGAAAIVVGLPRNMDGSEGPRAERCRLFAEMLNSETGIPVAMSDERLSTVAASRFLNATDTRGKARKKVIDALSAELILQGALDRMRHTQGL
ncbi:MAG: Holliday junction resolvase RuvX [Clostridia bacterium]|nr:Holliday junction resolvase RuvX [Clostridia bacterium]